MSGVRSGVNGTPTFLMNGVRHDDSCDPETLLNAIETASGIVTDRRQSGFAYGPWQIDGGPPRVAMDAPRGKPARRTVEPRLRGLRP
jgi:hypothetical protein